MLIYWYFLVNILIEIMIPRRYNYKWNQGVNQIKLIISVNKNILLVQSIIRLFIYNLKYLDYINM